MDSSLGCWVVDVMGSCVVDASGRTVSEVMDATGLSVIDSAGICVVSPGCCFIVGIVVEELKTGKRVDSGIKFGILSAPGANVGPSARGASVGFPWPRRNVGRLVCPGARVGFG